MRSDIFLLESSHALYVVASIKSWNKGYRAYSLFLNVMIVLSMVNHNQEQLFPYSKQKSIEFVEWFEKMYVYATILYSSLQFRNHISWKNWVFLILCLGIYYFSNVEWYLKNMFSYVLLHTIWHLGTGLILIRIIDESPSIS